MSNELVIDNGFKRIHGLQIKNIRLLTVADCDRKEWDAWQQLVNVDNDNKNCEMLFIEFTNGEIIAIWDNASYCCECRHMSTDDDLQSFVGDFVIGFELKQVPRPKEMPPQLPGVGVLVDENGEVVPLPGQPEPVKPLQSTVDEEWGDCHEVEFLEIQTNRNYITMVIHNEHNGYYGGFDLEARLVSKFPYAPVVEPTKTPEVDVTPPNSNRNHLELR